ncbi:redoxin domain-containing protein [Alteromonas halophila]|uniref:Thioredoxin family protein n=1 Tax=Alteromonas halophila TaxID=516698 RepID=A0A918JM62_9ALTE|nr:redoxin domain-containing protein [Alteromonas halophila]GGW89407.1 thioredoxin family protein [Alteromonas halophila]
MHRKLLSGLAVAGILSTQAVAGSVNEPAPAFSLQNSYGETVSLSEFEGKHVILEWTNHECPYVKKHYGADNMQALQRTYTDEDVVWLTIISSAPGKQGHVSAQTANELTDSREAAPTHVLFDPDGDVGRMYKAKTTPHMYIVDPKGTLQYAGAIDSIKSANPADIPNAVNYVTSGMDALAAGSDPNPELTAPYGCSIKYKS